MKITLEEWNKLATLKKAAGTAVFDLEMELLNILGKDYGPRELELLKKFLSSIDNAQAALGSLDFQVQQEWMGGDSSDPKNFKYREPNCCGLSNRRYFDPLES